MSGPLLRAATMRRPRVASGPEDEQAAAAVAAGTCSSAPLQSLLVEECFYLVQSGQLKYLHSTGGGGGVGAGARSMARNCRHGNKEKKSSLLLFSSAGFIIIIYLRTTCHAPSQAAPQPNVNVCECARACARANEKPFGLVVGLMIGSPQRRTNFAQSLSRRSEFNGDYLLELNTGLGWCAREKPAPVSPRPMRNKQTKQNRTEPSQARTRPIPVSSS